MELTQLLPYLQNPAYRYPLTEKAKAVKKALADTFGEEFPEYLKGKHPVDTAKGDRQLDYKKSLYRNPFRAIPGRVADKLHKLRVADDFTVAFPAQEGSQTLKQYIEEDFGLLGSLDEWFFSEWVKTYLLDPNAKQVEFTPAAPTTDRELPRPLSYLIGSENVVDFVPGRWAVLESPEKSLIAVNGKLVREGRIVLFFDETTYTVATEVDRRGGVDSSKSVFEILGYREAFDLQVTPKGDPGTEAPPVTLTVPAQLVAPPHHCPRMPVRDIGKPSLATFTNERGAKVYDSILTAGLNPLRDAQEMYLKSRVEGDNHLYSLRWQYMTSECPLIAKDTCSGGILTKDYNDGRFAHPKGSVCPVCAGTSFISPKSALDTINVSVKKRRGAPTDTGEPEPRPPFAGYVEKSIEPLKVMLEQVVKGEEAFWDTLEMPWMKRAPMAGDSGFKTLVDRQPATDWFRAQSGHVVPVGYETAIRNVAFQRYLVAEGQAAVRQMLPKVSIPKAVDIYDPVYLLTELQTARDAGLDSAIVAALQKEYERRKNGKDSETYRILELKSQLQPQFGRSLSDVLLIGLPRAKFILYSQFDDFTRRAILENPGFWEMEADEVKTLFEGYVAEVEALTPSLYTPPAPGKGQPPKMEAAAAFAVGDAVMVKPGKEHMPEHKGKTFTVAEVQGDTFAVKLAGKVHKWYTADELMKM